MMLKGERRGQVIAHLAALGLAAGVSLYIGISGYPHLFWQLWGVWLYTGLVTLALILELLALMRRRRPVFGD